MRYQHPKKLNLHQYRPGVGLMIVNESKKIFLGRRHESKKYWQMPQGGIEEGETPINTAFREMQEEVGTNKCKILMETKKWYFYDIPTRKRANLWSRDYVGQIQKWFLIRFLGENEDIDIHCSKDSEFQEWKWEDIENVINSTIPFKRKLYASIIKEFKHFFE